MAEDAIVVKGWPELARGTSLLAANIERDTGQRFAGVANQVAGQTRGGVPVVSGQLAASVTIDPGPPVSVGMGGGAASEYAGWIEFGGKGRPYLPGGRYLLPAAMAAEAQVVAAAQASADTETKGMTWPTPT